jgi:uncharacterized protein YukE
MSELSVSDVLSLNRQNDNGIFGGGNSSLIILILFFLCMGGNGIFGRGGDCATKGDVAEAIQAQSITSDIRALQGYTAESFNNQNLSWLSNMNALQNVINQTSNGLALGMNTGFSGINYNMNQGFNNVGAAIAGLGSQMAQCCCDLKSSLLTDGALTRQLIQDTNMQNLRDKLEDKDRELLQASFISSQLAQTNNLQNFFRNYMNGTCGCAA